MRLIICDVNNFDGFLTELEKANDYVEFDIPESITVLQGMQVLNRVKQNKWITDGKYTLSGEEYYGKYMWGSGVEGRERFFSCTKKEIYDEITSIFRVRRFLLDDYICSLMY